MTIIKRALRTTVWALASLSVGFVGGAAIQFAMPDEPAFVVMEVAP